MEFDDELLSALRRLGLLETGEQPEAEALGGGVSSDIWKVRTRTRTICVKRALAKLKVAADWFAPIERNAYEAAWMREAARIVPEAVPALLGQDEESGVLAMDFLSPERFALWKDQLRQGKADPETASAVGDRLVRIHSASAKRQGLPERFATDDIFYDIRLEPYLAATASAHPDQAPALHRLIETTRSTRLALVHGDVSPKNILIGDDGPVFLDAECAWFGDPAFDLAFCLNHLFLKSVWVPEAEAAFLDCFDALVERYLAGVDWEPRGNLEARTAALLPGLMLGRIDGKSPVEYLTEESDKDRVRAFARARLDTPPKRLLELRTDWSLGESR
ncbi:MAG: aminoglycoside phosphotransferase family protein [Pseudomonadota bacterium]